MTFEDIRFFVLLLIAVLGIAFALMLAHAAKRADEDMEQVRDEHLRALERVHEAVRT